MSRNTIPQKHNSTLLYDTLKIMKLKVTGSIRLYKRMEYSMCSQNGLNNSGCEIGSYSYVDRPATDQCLKLTEKSTFRVGTQNQTLITRKRKKKSRRMSRNRCSGGFNIQILLPWEKRKIFQKQLLEESAAEEEVWCCWKLT